MIKINNSSLSLLIVHNNKLVEQLEQDLKYLVLVLIWASLVSLTYKSNQMMWRKIYLQHKKLQSLLHLLKRDRQWD